MLRELIHLARTTPGTLVLKKKLSQVDLYDTLMDRANAAGLAEKRRALIADLGGRDVLEMGCGTGINFEFYDHEARVRAIDLDEDFLVRANTRARANIVIEKNDACALPFENGSFDVVIVCLVLCSIPQAKRALEEAKRVLRKDGELRAIEHVISDGVIARPLMHVVDPIWLWLNEQGCHMNCDTEKTMRGVFDDVTIVDRFQIYSAGLPAFPMVSLRATKRS